MQTQQRKHKQTISLNFLVFNTSKHLQQTEPLSGFLRFHQTAGVWGEQLKTSTATTKLFLFLLISSPSLSCPLPFSPPIPSPYVTFSNVSITAGHKPLCCMCVCASTRGREKETKEDHIKDFPLPFTLKCPPSLCLLLPSHVASSNQ